MAGMKQEYNPNKVKRRKRRPIIYIICEGEETEIKYFKHFRSRNCLVEVTPMTSKHKAAEHLVKHARQLIGQSEYRPKDGDEIWCVFDCDDNSNEALRAATDAAEKNSFRTLSLCSKATGSGERWWTRRSLERYLSLPAT